VRFPIPSIQNGNPHLTLDQWTHKSSITFQNQTLDDNAKVAEKERKRREIRERLEAQIKSTQKKKGFMTPERKKRLRVSFQ